MHGLCGQLPVLEPPSTTSARKLDTRRRHTSLSSPIVNLSNERLLAFDGDEKACLPLPALQLRPPVSVGLLCDSYL